MHISYERHHQHSYYLIKNGDLRGFDPQEIEVIALIARYHRQATPKKSHEGYGDSRGTARDRQAAVGDGAARRRPRSQPRPDRQGIDLYPRGDDYLARLRATGDAELELWAPTVTRSRSKESRQADPLRGGRQRKGGAGGRDNAC